MLIPFCRAGIAAACLALAVNLSGCGNPVAWEEPPGGADSLINYYRTPHFVFFYDINSYLRREIEANGKTKEAHLKRIESELGVSFDKEIMVRLISESGQNWSGQAYPREPYFIQETRNYFVQDNGHEIVHIVSFETLGLPEKRMFVEGLAAAHELDARPKWTRLCYSEMDSTDAFRFLGEMVDARVSEIVDYDLAGAFVEWLEEEFGMEVFKAFYRDLSAFPGSSVSSLYARNFGLNEDRLHGRFISERFNMVNAGKYCAQ